MSSRSAARLICLSVLSTFLLAGGSGFAETGREDTGARAPEKVPAGTEQTPAPVADTVAAKATESANGTAPQPPAVAGMTVYKDPVSGRLMPLPAHELRRLLSPDLQHATSMSQVGLTEEALPGGGVTLDLQGRFRSFTWATIGADGKVTVHCDDPSPEKE